MLIDVEELKAYYKNNSQFSENAFWIVYAAGAYNTSVLLKLEREEFEKQSYALSEILIRKYSLILSKKRNYVYSILSMFYGYGLSNQEVISFLQAAIKGEIVDLSQILVKKRGNINDLVRDPYKHIFNLVGRDFLSLKDPDATRGSVGSAELALVLLGTPCIKLEKGDIGLRHPLRLEDIWFSVEIKHSKITIKYTVRKNGTIHKYGRESGPRMTGVDMPKVNGKKEDIKKLLSKHFGLPRKQMVNAKGKLKFKLQPNGFIELNEITANLPNRRERMVAYTIDLVRICLPNINKEPNWQDYVEMMVNDDGSIDEDYNGNYMHGFCLLNFIEYKMSDQFYAMLFTNQDTMNYMIVDNVDELQRCFEEGLIRIIKGVDWNDSQNPAAAQLYFA